MTTPPHRPMLTEKEEWLLCKALVVLGLLYCAWELWRKTRG